MNNFIENVKDNINVEYKRIIDKIRNIIKIIKNNIKLRCQFKSPELVLDSQIKWGSLLKIIKIF